MLTFGNMTMTSKTLDMMNAIGDMFLTRNLKTVSKIVKKKVVLMRKDYESKNQQKIGIHTIK